VWFFSALSIYALPTKEQVQIMHFYLILVQTSVKIAKHFPCRVNNISGTEKTEFSDFLESLANASYINFRYIKEYPSIDVSDLYLKWVQTVEKLPLQPLLERLNIRPKDYMLLIYNLTEDLTLQTNQELKVRNVNNLEFIRTLQTLTEYGICYTTNNFIAPKLTPR